MPAKYSSTCKTCNSPNRLLIEKWRTEDGLNTAAISKRLKEIGESISRQALDNHFIEHYNIRKEVQEQFTQSQAQIEQTARDRIKETVMLSEVIAGKLAIHKRLESIFSNILAGAENAILEKRNLPIIPNSYVQLYIGCATEIRQCLKTKQELLGEDTDHKKPQTLESLSDDELNDRLAKLLAVLDRARSYSDNTRADQAQSQN